MPVISPDRRVRPTQFVWACPDPDDHVIATAVAARADLLVTGDRHLLDLGAHEAIRIIDPRRFLGELAKADPGTG